jgi:hypothetical protein
MNELFLVMGILGSAAAIAALIGLDIDHRQMKARIRQRIKAITKARP